MGNLSIKTGEKRTLEEEKVKICREYGELLADKNLMNT